MDEVSPKSLAKADASPDASPDPAPDAAPASVTVVDAGPPSLPAGASEGEVPPKPTAKADGTKKGNGKPEKPPRIRPGRNSSCTLPQGEWIRRVVQRHFNEIKFCYEKALMREPSLEGRVSVRFTIKPTGTVAKVKIADSTLKYEQVEECIVGAVKRWTFAQPCDDVVVTYPFLLKPPE